MTPLAVKGSLSTSASTCALSSARNSSSAPARFVGAEGPGHEEEALVGEAAQVVAVFGAQGVAGGDVVGVAVGDSEDRHRRSSCGSAGDGDCTRVRPRPAGLRAEAGVGQGESSSRTLPLVSIPNRAVIEAADERDDGEGEEHVADADAGDDEPDHDGADGRSGP